MDITFAPNGNLQIDGARIVYRNFEGRASKYSREGDRDFSVVIPDADICINKESVRRGAEPKYQPIVEALTNDVNKFGVGWNLKVKPPRDEDESSFVTLKVKVRFNGRGPKIYLTSNGSTVELDEDSVGCLDRIDISSVDLDIRPYDDEFGGKPFRAAYLQSMHVIQETDRFAARFANDEYPED